MNNESTDMSSVCYSACCLAWECIVTFTVVRQYLFQVIRGEWHASKLFPDRRSEIEIKRFLGPHSHSKQNAKKMKHSQMFFTGEWCVQQKTIAIVADLVGCIRCGNEQWHNSSFQFLQTSSQFTLLLRWHVQKTVDTFLIWKMCAN